ncbi:MAG: helix-turn-helix transcriptional regulator [Clostridia bacterium]|nr:helix-turn-helix transcriptional regulator [Clostridia bacterium]
MASKVGKLIKEARTAADLTQEQLARKVGGLTAGDISKAERGEKELTQAQLKKIAKATGVTQKSLLDAAKGTSSTKKTTARKTTAKKTATEKKPKTPSNAGITMRVTSTEKKLIEYYRLADSDTKKAATKVLKGESNDFVTTLLGGKDADDVADMLGDAIGTLFGGK